MLTWCRFLILSSVIIYKNKNNSCHYNHSMKRMWQLDSRWSWILIKVVREGHKNKILSYLVVFHLTGLHGLFLKRTSSWIRFQGNYHSGKSMQLVEKKILQVCFVYASCSSSSLLWTSNSTLLHTFTLTIFPLINAPGREIFGKRGV